MSDQNAVPETPQPQQSFGSAPAGSETIGAAPAPAPVEPAPKKKSPLPRIILSAVIGIVVLVGAGLWFGRDSAEQAKAGSCIGELPEVAPGQEIEVPEAKVVDCNTNDAIYKVEGRLDDKTQAEATNDTVCQAFPQAEFRYYSIGSGGKGYVLCLSQIAR